MSSHPLIDAFILQREIEINQEFEYILNQIEEHFNEHTITYPISASTAQKLVEKGYKCQQYSSGSYTIFW